MTLGSLMSFAIVLEKTAIEFSESLDKLGEAHRKRWRFLEEARREKLNEVTLEPISGFEASKYLVKTDSITSTVRREFETTSAGFYRDAAGLVRSMAPEIARLFERLAKENESFALELGTGQ